MKDPGGMPKRIIILGATGSIGASAADVVRTHPADFSVVAVSARSSRERAEALAAELGARAYVGEDAAKYMMDKGICLEELIAMF